MKAHTSLLKGLLGHLNKALDEERERSGIALTRRDFLKSAAAVGALAAFGGGTATTLLAKEKPARIAIIGAGIAGLTAAHHLTDFGLPFTIYEASKYAGGRMHTHYDAFKQGFHVEIGGEFIDSDHVDIRDLAKHYNLPLLDKTDYEKNLIPETFYIDGKVIVEADLQAGFKIIAPRILADISAIGSNPTYRNHTPDAARLDLVPLSKYLFNLGGPEWLEKLLNVAYLTEYGLDTTEQSTLNFLTVLSDYQKDTEFKLFGNSDERYKIIAGNEALPKTMGERFKKQIRYEHVLEKLSKDGEEFVLTFRHGAATNIVRADIVLTTIPFSVFRGVDLDLDLPEKKKLAIRELGYGVSGKVIWETKSRPWREHGFAGYTFTTERFQCGWDSSEGQQAKHGDAGAFTMFMGGTTALEMAKRTKSDLQRELLPGLETIYPNPTAYTLGNLIRFAWSEQPLTKGGYSCYKPGQWTTFGGVEPEPVGNLFFAGEHTNIEFQGFMNGGAKSGRLAAADIARSQGIEVGEHYFK